jgi:hypothetical protein
MSLKAIIQGLAVIWLVLFGISFVSLQVMESDDFASGLNRIVAFLTWQTIALVVAAIGALATRRAIAKGAQKVKLVGYVPLGISVFLVAAFIAIVAYRVFVVPLFESAA